MSDQQSPSHPHADNDGTSPDAGTTYSQPYVSPVYPAQQPYGLPGPQPQSPYPAAQCTAGQSYAGPYPGYAIPLSLPEHPSATPSLILGILSLVVCGLTAPFGLYMAVKGRRAVAETPGVYRNGGSLTAGFVLNIIGLVNLAGIAIYVLFWILIYGGIFAGLMAASAH